jgi:hypothetical protein
VIEKTLEKAYVELLNKLELPFLKLTNKGLKQGNFHDALGMPNNKFFPDLCFPFNGQIHFRELGIAGRHKERKQAQQFKAGWWLKHLPGTFRIITSEDGMREDWLEIGLVGGQNEKDG